MNEGLILEALYKTDPNLYSDVGGQAYQSALVKKGARVFKYRKYERGDHDANLTDQQRKLLNILPDMAELNEANSNYCGLVIDMMAGRLAVGEINSLDEATSDWINDTLSRNEFESKQGEWFRGAIRDSESFVIVDPQTALWVSEPAFDGYSGITAIYDTVTGLPKWACKLWSTNELSAVSTDAEDSDREDIVHVVVYQPGIITYWEGTAGGSELTKTDEQEWKLGVIPIVQFANKRDNYTHYGESEIRVVLPLQDIVNATLYDMMMASKLSAFKIYWSIGMEIDKDGIVPGSVINLVLKDSKGKLVTNIDEAVARFLNAVKVGEFGTTDMSQYTNQLDKLEREISQVSATPVYGVTNTGQVSGEALKQIEVGLRNKVIRFQKENTGQIKMLLRMTALIQKTFDINKTFTETPATKFLELSAPSRPPGDIESLNISWVSPEIVDTATEITALSTMRRDNPNLWPDEWYRERIGGLLGMSSQQIAEEGEKADSERVSAFDMLVAGRSGTAPII